MQTQNNERRIMNMCISLRGPILAIIVAIAGFVSVSPLLGQIPVDKPAGPAAVEPTLKLRSFTIVVRDYDEAKNWYLEKLGFVTLIDQKFGPVQRFVLIAPPGASKDDVGFVLEKARRDDPSMPADYTDRIGKEVNIVLKTN